VEYNYLLHNLQVLDEKGVLLQLNNFFNANRMGEIGVGFSNGHGFVICYVRVDN